jgi:hypothetical protein
MNACLEDIRLGKPIIEDEVFGFRAEAPALVCNDSYFQNKMIRWDLLRMMLV